MSKDTGMMAAVAAAAGLSEDEPVEINAAFVKQYFPAVAAELVKQGAKAELDRIAGIEKAALPGHEKIIAAHKADASKTPADAMQAVIEAERASRGKHLAALDTDEAKVKGLRSEPANGTETETNKPGYGLEGDAKWKAEYAGLKDLQAEFLTEAAYLGFKRADARGAVKILNTKAG